MKSKSYGIWGKYLKVISYIVLTLLITEPVVSQNIQLANDELSYALTERFPNMTIKQDGVRSASLNKIISVQYEEALFMDVLQDIVQNEDFRLSYSDQYLPLEKKVTVDLKNVTVNEALWAILDDTGLRYALSPNNHLVLMKRHQGINQTVIQEAVQETITGTVTDAGTGETLPGVNILVVGTSTGTSTDTEGSYSLNATESDTLVFSYLGYISQRVAVGDQAVIDVGLESDFETMEEMVVVGYGTQRAINLTGSISRVSASDLTQNHVGQTSAALQGIAPGVTITQRSGQPGNDGGDIRIRGIGTLGDPDPLILVDGVEANINNVNPDAIESISILKDAASASIYGSRAANGVVLVTTKRGIEGFSLSYSTSTGWQTPTDMPNIVNAVDHMEMTNEAYTNVGRSPLYSEASIETFMSESPSDQYPDTDWQQLTMYDNAFMQDHSLSINAGSENVSVYGTLNYSDHGGITPNTDFKRYSMRVNSDIRINDKLNSSIDIFLRNTVTNQPSNGTAYLFHWMRRIPANEAGILSNGLYGQGWNGDNPLARARDGGLRTAENMDGILNFKLNYSPTDWLSAEVMYAPKIYEPYTKQFNAITQTYQYDGTPSYSIPSRNSLTEQYNREWSNNLLATAEFDNEFIDSHQITALVGFQQEDQSTNWISAYRENFELPDYRVINSGNRDNERTEGSSSHWSLRSLFGRLNYNISDKYLFEGNLRYDGSSRFAEQNRYALFPSFSAGWNISEEPFMSGISHILEILKVRASWGRLGNQNIGLYPYAAFIDVGGSNYAFDNNLSAGASLNDLANPDIRWETTEILDIGIDVNLWGNLDITADYFHKETSDILLRLDIPHSLGLNPPYQNAGVVENKGWDLSIGYQDRIEELNYSISLNLSDVKNEILDMRGISNTGRTVDREGYPIGSFFGYEADGFFQNEAEIEDHATQFGSIAPGDIKYKDLNGDDLINDDDRRVIGSPVPRYTFGANFNLGYKGIDFDLFLQGVGKAEGFMFGQGIQAFHLGGTVQEQHKDRWTPDNTDAAFPRFAFNEINNEQNSTFWMRDASYLRVKNLQIGYNLPQQLIGNIQRVRIHVSGRNLFTLDNFWEGYDPEAPVSNGGWYPQMRTYSIGLDIQF